MNFPFSCQPVKTGVFCYQWQSILSPPFHLPHTQTHDRPGRLVADDSPWQQRLTLTLNATVLTAKHHLLTQTHSHTFMISVTHFFPLPVGRQQQKTTVINVAVWAGLGQTCGQQEFSWATLLLWLVCSEWGWKNVKRHRVDRVSPEGRTWRGGKTRQRVGGLHWPLETRGSRGERQGRAALYVSVSPFLFSAPLFF